jgi:lambda family phage portal protein
MRPKVKRSNKTTVLNAGHAAPGVMATAHSGASRTDRTMMNWHPQAGSADADLLPELDILATRSRDLARNNGLAAGGLQTLKDNIVGSVLRLSALPDYRLLGWDRDQAREWGNATEAEFRSWADSTDCDAARTLNLLGQTLLMLSGSLLNGDALCLPVWAPRPDARWATRLMIVEADRLATPPGMAGRQNIRAGIESDRYGAPLAYWIRKTHPGDVYGMGNFMSFAPDEWERVPAFTDWGRRRVIHLHDKERTGQSRGKPIVTSVMREFHMAGKYATTELQAAVSNSLIAAFLESDLSPDASAALFGDEPRAEWGASVEQAQRIRQLQGGAIIPLPAGAKLSPFVPGRPNAAFEAFMVSTLRHIAAGLNIPYELLLKDFSKTNYSSARAALLEAWRYFHGRRRWLTDYWLRPVYELWLEEAINAGRIDAPGYYENRYAYTRCRFIFNGRGWVDPVKEAQAAIMRMNAGLSTMEAECAEQGLDWEDVIEQSAYEKAKKAALGLDTAPAADSKPTVQSTEQEGDTSTQDVLVGAMGTLAASMQTLASLPAPVPVLNIHPPAPRAVKRIPVRDPETGLIVEIHEVEDGSDEPAEAGDEE